MSSALKVVKKIYRVYECFTGSLHASENKESKDMARRHTEISHQWSKGMDFLISFTLCLSLKLENSFLFFINRRTERTTCISK